MTREDTRIKLLEIMNARYFEKDHLCLKSFIHDVDHFVISELEAQNKALTDMVQLQSEKISRLECNNKALKDERANMVKTHRKTIRKLEIDVSTLEVMDYLNKQELEELRQKGN